MQSYDRYEYFNRLQTDNGKTVSSTTQQAARTKLTVLIPGTYSGDKVTPNPFAYKKVTSRNTMGINYQLRYNGGVNPWTVTWVTNDYPYYIGSSFSESPRITPDYGRTSDRCMEKIYEQIRGQGNLVVDLAESSATIRMLRNTTNLRKFMLGFFNRHMPRKGHIWRRGPSGKWRQQKRALNDNPETVRRELSDLLSSKWLEYRYGWMPLTYSIYDALDTLAHSKRVNTQLVKARSGYLDSRTTISQSGSDVITETLDTSVRTEIGIWFDLDPAKQIYDWTSLNPLRIGWELLPLSFVADWVVNISQQLELLENRWLFASKFRDGYKTNGLAENRVYFARSEFSSGTGILRQTRKLHSVRARYTEMTRSKLTSLPYPAGLRLQLKLGSKRQLDAAALIHQLVYKKLRS